MNRVVRGSSLMLMTAIVAACAAHRDENQGDADKQAAQQRQGPAPQPATDEIDSKLAKAEPEERERALLEDITVAAQRRDQSTLQATPVTIVSQEMVAGAAIASPTAPAKVAGNFAFGAPPYQQVQNTERYQHLDDNAVHLVADQPISTFSIDV